VSDVHVIDLQAHGYTLRHPLACRPQLFECPVNDAATRFSPPRMPGQYGQPVVGRWVCDLNAGAELTLIRPAAAADLVDDPGAPLDRLDRKTIAASIDWSPTCQPGGEPAAIVDQVLRLAALELRGEGGERTGRHGDTAGRGLTSTAVPRPTDEPGSPATPSSRSWHDLVPPTHHRDALTAVCSAVLGHGEVGAGYSREFYGYLIDVVVERLHLDEALRELDAFRQDEIERPRPLALAALRQCGQHCRALQQQLDDANTRLARSAAQATPLELEGDPR
jgi:hypothetical protein